MVEERWGGTERGGKRGMDRGGGSSWRNEGRIGGLGGGKLDGMGMEWGGKGGGV